MDRSRCTAILKAILDRNYRIWAPVLDSKRWFLWFPLGIGLLLLYQGALALVLLLAVIGGAHALDVLTGADLGRIEYAWLEPTFVFAIDLVSYTWFVIVIGFCASLFLAEITRIVSKQRQPEERAV